MVVAPSAMPQVQHSVTYVNDYCGEHLDGLLTCAVDPNKGRILCTGQAHQAGDCIFSEPPQLMVAEAPGDPAFQRVKQLVAQHNFAHAPLWYWSALCSLTQEEVDGCELDVPSATSEQQQRLLFLFHPEDTHVSADIATLTETFWPRLSAESLDRKAEKLELLLAVWLLNCFEHTEDPFGFSTFFLPSFLSHSCRPNCMWHYLGDHFVLRARQDIAVGDEITVSYLCEETLLESTKSRRSQLEASKHFLCCCELCETPLDRATAFSCPSCKSGEILLDTTRGDAAPCAAGKCAQCGFIPTPAQVDDLCRQEAIVEERVRDWERRGAKVAPDAYMTVEVALRLEENLTGLFSSHHWVRDRAERQLLAFYESAGRAELALALAQRSVKFIVDSFPGYSAVHAWALETEADLKLRVAQFAEVQVSTVGKLPISITVRELAKLQDEVGPLYAQAATILNVLFGSDHEFHQQLRNKCDSLERAVPRKKASKSSKVAKSKGTAKAKEPKDVKDSRQPKPLDSARAKNRVLEVTGVGPNLSLPVEASGCFSASDTSFVSDRLVC